jgi:3-hydroxyisobutyrate dehydrogenase-like beta-hydroxyacid dehydrogenase
MGKRLLSAGYSLCVVPHRNSAPARELASSGAVVVNSPADLADQCAVVITCVPDSPQVSQVLFGEAGLASRPSVGLLHIDMSTISPSASLDFHARLNSLGIETLDAPVSGGPARAADGTLTIMVGGEDAPFERGLPVLQALGKHITHVGGPSSGQVVKMVNQLMISIIMVANAEALSLGVKAGVPLKTLTEVIGTSSGSNYLMQQWLTRTLFSGDMQSGFALDLLMKDLRAALSWADELQAPTFGGSLAQQLYRMAKIEGGGRLDYSAVARLYEEANGVKLRLENDT